MQMQLKHLAAIYRIGQKLENIDGTPNEARLQHLRDFLDCYQLPENGVSMIQNLADEMTDDRAILLIKDLDKDDKLKITHLYANIVCTDDKLTETGRDYVSKIVLTCNLPIPGAEDQWKEVCHDNSQDQENPIVPSFIHVRPNGFVSRLQSDHEDWQTLGKEIAEWIGAHRTEVVRFTPALNEISKRLRLKGRHLVFLVDSYGRTKDLDDNLTGTRLYGGAEIMGDIVIALETDEGYNLEGIRNDNLLFDILYLVADETNSLLPVD